MSAVAVDYATAPDELTRAVRMPARPALVLVPTGAAAGGGARIRPTRAARLIVTLVATLVLAAAVSVATGAWGSAAPAPHTVTVRSGQTLSGIAAHELPSLPISQAILRIQLANNMSTGGVNAGQVLVIPAAG